MKIRPKITIEEFLSMSQKDLDEFIGNDERLISEGLIDESEPNIDFMGMTDDEIIQKYNLIPINVVHDEIKQKLNR